MIQPDEIYLAGFPYGDSAGMKLRPVLTLTATLGPVPEVLVAYLPSVVPHPLLPSNEILGSTTPEHTATNSKARSALRLHKLATIHRSAIVRRLGCLSSRTTTEVDRKLGALLTL